MVSAGNPQSGVPLHPLEADEDVLEGGVHGVSHVELAGDVRGRHDDGEGLLVRVTVTAEAAAFFPLLINPRFYFFGVIYFW